MEKDNTTQRKTSTIISKLTNNDKKSKQWVQERKTRDEL